MGGKMDAVLSGICSYMFKLVYLSLQFSYAQNPPPKNYDTLYWAYANRIGAKDHFSREGI